MTRANPLSMQQVYLIPEAFLSGSKQVRTSADAIFIQREAEKKECHGHARPRKRGEQLQARERFMQVLSPEMFRALVSSSWHHGGRLN